MGKSFMGNSRQNCLGNNRKNFQKISRISQNIPDEIRESIFSENPEFIQRNSVKKIKKNVKKNFQKNSNQRQNLQGNFRNKVHCELQECIGCIGKAFGEFPGTMNELRLKNIRRNLQEKYNQNSLENSMRNFQGTFRENIEGN